MFDEGTAVRAPTRFWVVAVLGLLWNSIGAVDYTMTRLRNVDYLSAAGDPQVMLNWIDSFPLWAQIVWALGVWGSFAGSLLMLARSRHAATSFLVSAVSATISFAYQLTHTPGGTSSNMNRIMALLIVGVVILLWRYCVRLTGQGVLR